LRLRLFAFLAEWLLALLTVWLTLIVWFFHALRLWPPVKPGKTNPRVASRAA
jgi:hypothetical protein